MALWAAFSGAIVLKGAKTGLFPVPGCCQVRKILKAFDGWQAMGLCCYVKTGAVGARFHVKKPFSRPRL